MPDTVVQVGTPKNQRNPVIKIHRYMHAALNNVVWQSHSPDLFQKPIAA